jgi:hypothetical protein
MRYLKKFNEAIVDYKSDDVDSLMGEINTYPRSHRFQLISRRIIYQSIIEKLE